MNSWTRQQALIATASQNEGRLPKTFPSNQREIRGAERLSADADLPRLLYLADVPVDESFGGSMQCYRLLKEYPPERLLVIETNLQPSPNGRRLEGVAYRRLKFAKERLLRTRLRNAYGSMLALAADRRARRVPKLVGGFEPQAVLSVAHGFSWMTAFRYAAAHDFPFHLIVHDDWKRMVPAAEPVHRVVAGRFAAAYRSAAECYNISPYMEEFHRRQLRRHAAVLPPCRDENLPRYSMPKAEERNSLVFAYAGALHDDGYRDLLLRLARFLPEDCRLLAFSPESGFELPPELHGRIDLRSPLPLDELIPTLRAKADVLFCPSSFDANSRHAMSVNLPSKLAEYTATGLPLLIWGPPDSSAVKWAAEREGSAVVVTEEDEATVRLAIERLRDWTTRRSVASVAITAGDEYFSPRAARQVLYDGLLRSRRGSAHAFASNDGA